MKKYKVILTTTMFLVLVCSLMVFAAQKANLETAGVINVNKATVEQLQMLPSITGDIANNIVSFRSSNGPFRSLDELMKIKGISRTLLNDIKPWLVLEGDTTFDPTAYKSKASTQGHMQDIR